MKNKASNIKKSPFDISHQGETIDDQFFKRLIRLEKYFAKQSVEETCRSAQEGMQQINEILQEPLLSLEDVRLAIGVYNEYTDVFQKDKTGWYDLRLHLRHIAFVFGEEYELGDAFRLTKKEQ